MASNGLRMMTMPRSKLHALLWCNRCVFWAIVVRSIQSTSSPAHPYCFKWFEPRLFPWVNYCAESDEEMRNETQVLLHWQSVDPLACFLSSSQTPYEVDVVPTYSPSPERKTGLQLVAVDRDERTWAIRCTSQSTRGWSCPLATSPDALTPARAWNREVFWRHQFVHMDSCHAHLAGLSIQ